MKLTTSIATPTGCNASYPKHFCQVTLTVNRYPFILLGGERHCDSIKCLVQEHNTVTPARAPTQTARSGDKQANYSRTSINGHLSITVTSLQRPGFFGPTINQYIHFTLIETSLQRPPLYNGQLFRPQGGRCREVQLY